MRFSNSNCSLFLKTHRFMWLTSNQMYFWGDFGKNQPSVFKKIEITLASSGYFQIFFKTSGWFFPNHPQKHVITNTNQMCIQFTANNNVVIITKTLSTNGLFHFLSIQGLDELLQGGDWLKNFKGVLTEN